MLKNLPIIASHILPIVLKSSPIIPLILLGQ